MQPRYLLGIDAGGSKSQVVLWEFPTPQSASNLVPSDVLARALWQERFAGINLDAISLEQATQRLIQMLTAASQAVESSVSSFLSETQVVLGMAGLDTPLDRENAQSWSESVLTSLSDSLSYSFQLLSDVELALWSGRPDGAGIALIAGTGSNCFGRTADGRTAKAGGFSHYFSDEGSGFWLGWEALHILGKMFDGRLEKTALFSKILERYEVPDFPALKHKVVQADDPKQMVARAAPVVQELAVQGEVWSQRLVEQALKDLEAMVLQVSNQLEPQQKSLPLYFVGGIFADQPYLSALQSRLGSHGVPFSEARLAYPVTGAWWWAQRV